MNLQETKSKSCCTLLPVFALFAGATGLSYAGETCPTNGSGPDICVAFDSATPVLGSDFTVDYATDASNPSVTLLVANLTWNVRSDDGGSAGNIGNIFIVNSTADDFKVTIADGANPGAVDVQSIILTDGGFTGYSSIAGNISGDLNGDLTVVKSGTSGGSADGFTIDGDVDGDITIPFADGFTILGEFGVATGDPHTLDVEEITGGDLIINSARNVFITVSVKISAGRLVINENMLDNCAMSIELIESCGSLGGGESPLEIGNDLTEGNATADVAISLGSDLASDCKLDMKNADLQGNLLSATHDLDGEIHMYRYTAGVSAFSDISGTLKVTEDMTSGKFLIYNNIESGGLIDINGDCDGWIRVDGSISGTVDIDGSLVAGASNKITVVGTVSSTGDILIGEDCAALVQVLGAMAGDIFIGDDVTLAGNLTSDGEIRLHAAMSGTLDIDGNLAGKVFVGFGGTASLTGDIVIDGDLSGLIDISDDLSGTGCGNDSGCINVSGGDITSTGVIQIDDACTGEILTGGDLDGDILIIGNLSGDITIGDSTTEVIGLGGLIDVNGTASGTITVADAMAGFDIWLAVIDIAGAVSGTIHINGAVNQVSDIILGDDLTSTGAITVDGILGGDVTIAGSCAGDITVGTGSTGGISSAGSIDIGTDLIGDIDIKEDMDGLIAIGGKLASSGPARILVAGMANGDITIWKETEEQTLIRITEGIDVDAVITVNDSETDALDANGTIHIGPVFWASVQPPDIIYDGSIMIKDGSSSGGDLEGTITVNGCHATPADLDICICGTNNGSVTITQTNCTNQVDWSCVSNCP